MIPPPADLSGLSDKAQLLLRALAEHSRIILPNERAAADELKRRKLIERERRSGHIMRPTLAAMRALWLAERGVLDKVFVKAGAICVRCT